MTERSEPILAGVELGGTKAIAVIGRGRHILDRETIATTTPAATLGALAARLAAWRVEHDPIALGVASFGPVAIGEGGADRGRILTTPKPGWTGTDLLAPLAAALPVPIALHTDVTAAALAEGRWGAARGLDDFVYVTLGTGIGMGVIAGGRPVVGAMHPEAGHVRVRRLAGDGFAGVCPFHGDCLEGLASGPAVAARAGAPSSALAPDDPAWRFVADAIAESFAGLFLTLSCRAILVGGGVGTGQPQLLARVRPLVVAKLAGYLPGIDERSITGMIVPAALGAEAGPLGALALADRAARLSSSPRNGP